MNTLESHITEFIPGTEETCAKFTIDDSTIPFVLHSITKANQEYTLGLWIKGDANGSITVNDHTIPVTTDWTRHVLTYVATGANLNILFDIVGTYYIYRPKLEIGNAASDWSPNPNDAAESNEFKVNITNQGVAFMNGSDVPTRVDKDGLVTRDLTVEGTYRHGDWAWEQRSTGNYGLVWKGVTE